MFHVLRKKNIKSRRMGRKSYNEMNPNQMNLAVFQIHNNVRNKLECENGRYQNKLLAWVEKGGGYLDR